MLRKSKNIALLFSIVLSCAGLTSCDDDCKDITYLPQSFLNYWYFNQGSYWVYQSNDSTTIVYDTVRVVGASRKVEQPSREGERPSCIEWADLSLEHSDTSFFNTSPIYPYTRILSFYDSETKVFFCVSNFNWLSLDEQYFLYYSDEGNAILQSEDPALWVLVEQVALSTPVGIFENVLHYKIVNQMDLFFAPGVGIVKIICSNNQTWELVQYSVSQ